MVSMDIASMWASMASWFTPTILFCAANLIIATIYIASNNQTKHHDHHHDHFHEDHHNHNNNNNNNNNNNPPTRMSRVSSFLDRARSFKLPYYSTNTTESQPQYPLESKTATYSSTSRLAQSIHLPTTESLYTSEPETHPLSQPAHTTPSFLERVKSMKFSTDTTNSPGQLTRAPSFLDRVRSFRFSSGSTQQNTPDPNPNPDPGHNPEHHVIRTQSENTKKVKKKKKKLPTELKKSRSEMKMAASDDDDVDSRRPATARVRGSKDVDEEVDAKADDFISRFKQQLKLQRLESLVRYNQMINRGS